LFVGVGDFEGGVDRIVEQHARR